MKEKIFTSKEQAEWFLEGLKAANVGHARIIDMHYYPNRYLVEWIL